MKHRELEKRSNPVTLLLQREIMTWLYLSGKEMIETVHKYWQHRGRPGLLGTTLEKRRAKVIFATSGVITFRLLLKFKTSQSGLSLWSERLLARRAVLQRSSDFSSLIKKINKSKRIKEPLASSLLLQRLYPPSSHSGGGKEWGDRRGCLILLVVTSLLLSKLLVILLMKGD